ncbi:MAG: hypothetical protein GDA42_06105 [Ekhidna sp.]|nr:hypothetical protein [Ekhidna sp.]
MKFLFLIVTLTSVTFSFSQSGSYQFGARSSAMGGASLTLADEYSLFNNIGALGRLDHHSIFAGYQNRYGITEFQTIAGGAVYKHRLGNAGVGYYKFGDDLFSEQRLHLAIGNQLQMVSLGLGVDIIQYHVESVGTKQVMVVEFGGLAEITPQLFFGAHIFNITQAETGLQSDESLPTVMKAGFSYRPSDELILSVEVEKDLDFDEIIKAGIEYMIVKDIFLRTGISTRPFIAAFGIGFHPKRLKLDYAFSDDSELGNIHEITIAYQLGK